jgi:hypothetical protein
VAERIPGFAAVAYPDWTALLSRLAREASMLHWRGPIVLDELPYLVATTPELASILQRWVDHEARTARLVVALAGSSQRMMQGIVLDGNAPLYGRAREILELKPLDVLTLQQAFRPPGIKDLVEAFTAWGGIPWYWELAIEQRGGIAAVIDRLVLDPRAPLHREPDRILSEEIPSAAELRPVLDAIGAGAHRLSEIGGRAGRVATSLSRPLARLVEMGLVGREIPFGEPEHSSKRSLYRISDPLFRLWFHVVAPHRGFLTTADRSARLALLARLWPQLVGATWEELCREQVSRWNADPTSGRRASWRAGARWWHGNAPEWDVVSESADGRRLLLGEARWRAKPVGAAELERLVREVEARPEPELGARFAHHQRVRALFLPAVEPHRVRSDVEVIAGEELIGPVV